MIYQQTEVDEALNNHQIIKMIADPKTSCCRSISLTLRMKPGISQILQCVNNRLRFLEDLYLDTFSSMIYREDKIMFAFNSIVLRLQKDLQAKRYFMLVRFTSKAPLYMLAKNASFQGGSGSEH
jgi:hypothetical protein